MIDLVGMPSPEGVSDQKVRSCLLTIIQNVKRLAGITTTEHNRAVSAAELISLGILKRDTAGNLYPRQATTSSERTQQAAATGVQSAVFEFDASDVVAAGAVAIGRIPANAIIIRAWYEVLQTFTSATDAATISLGIATDDPAGIAAAVAISDATNPWDQGIHEAIQTGAASAFSTKSTATRNVEATVAGETVTAGRLNLVIQYVVSE